MAEQGQERRTATKKRIEEFRQSNTELTDEQLTGIVETTYPDQYDAPAVAQEIVKELYRESLPLTEADFTNKLKEFSENRKLLRWDKETVKTTALVVASQQLIKKIYADATQRTTRLSEYPEYTGELKEYLENRAKERGKSLEYTIESLLNVEAMHQTSDDVVLRRKYTNFSCHTEPDGDIVFVPDGQEKTERPEPQPGRQETEQAGGNGCLGSVLFVAVVTILLFA